MLETNEEILDENQAQVENPDEEVEENQDNPDGKEPQNADTPKPDDAKEHNRQGYQQRQSKKGQVSREEFNQVQESVNKITEENTDLKFQKAHPELTQEAFNSLKVLSKGSGKGYDECLKDPAIQALVEVSKSKTRIDNATADPSTRTSQATDNDYANMSLSDISKKADEVRGRL